MIFETLLECPSTRDALPMCIITGKHMLLNDWCCCPITKFPALYSEYVKYIQYQEVIITDDSEGSVARDPILNKVVTIGDLKLCDIDEAKAYIRKYNNVKAETSKDAGPATDEVAGSPGKIATSPGKSTPASPDERMAKKVNMNAFGSGNDSAPPQKQQRDRSNRDRGGYRDPSKKVSFG